MRTIDQTPTLTQAQLRLVRVETALKGFERSCREYREAGTELPAELAATRRAWQGERDELRRMVRQIQTHFPRY